MSSSKKLKQEFEEFKDNAIINLGITVGLVEKHNYHKWKATLLGPKDSSYKGGLFYLELLFPEEYPNKVPEIRFLTPIYHINVNSKNKSGCPLGLLNINSVNIWKNKTNVREMLTKLYTIFYNPNPNFAYSTEIVNEFKQNRTLYEKKIIYFTNKYANMKNESKNWDFSCNINDLKHISLITKIISLNRKYDDIYIRLYFWLNSNYKTIIKCCLNESTAKVVREFINHNQIKGKREILFIFNNTRLIMDSTIGNNQLKDKTDVTVIVND